MLAAVCGHATGESPAQLVLTTRLPPCAAEGMAAGERCVAQSGSPELCCSGQSGEEVETSKLALLGFCGKVLVTVGLQGWLL